MLYFVIIILTIFCIVYSYMLLDMEVPGTACQPSSLRAAPTSPRGRGRGMDRGRGRGRGRARARARGRGRTRSRRGAGHASTKIVNCKLYFIFPGS